MITDISAGIFGKTRLVQFLNIFHATSHVVRIPSTRVVTKRVTGLEGITAINVWDEASTAVHALPFPLKFSINRKVSPRDIRLWAELLSASLSEMQCDAVTYVMTHAILGLLACGLKCPPGGKQSSI